MSVTAFDTAVEQTVVLAYRTHYANWVVVKRPTSASNGNLVNVTEAVALDTTRLTDPEVSVMHVDPTRFGGNAKIVGYFLGAAPPAKYEWRSLRTPGGGWTYEGEVQELYQPPCLPFGCGPLALRGLASQVSFRPAIVPYPDPNVTSSAVGAGACAVFPAADLEGKVYCYDRDSNAWRQLGATNAGATCLLGPDHTTCERIPLTRHPAIAYHKPRRTDNGLPITEGAGMLWIFLPTEPDGDGRFYRSVPFSPTTAPWSTAGASNYPGLNKFLEYGMWGTLSMYEDREVSALRAIVSFGGSENPLTNGGVWFLPFADGTVQVSLRDGNDFTVMERGLCLGLRASAGDAQSFCGREFPGGF